MSIGEIEGIVRKTNGSQVYYFGTLQSDKIKGVTFVPVIEHSRNTYLQEKVEDGYQRPGSKSRMRLFMNFLLEHRNAVVPPVVISTGDGWKFEHNEGAENFGRLQINSSAAIVDGQHRVGGYIALYEEHGKVRPVDFIALEGLSRDDEVNEFIVVNNTQKGVPKALTAFLEDQEEARIAWALNEEEDSPFKGRIARTGMTRPKLFALHSVARGIKRTFNHGKLSELDEETKVEFTFRYWTIIADEWDEMWDDIKKLDDSGRSSFEFKLLELTGFIVWSLMGPEILGRSYSEGIGMNWDNVRKLVAACGSIDWRKDGQYEGRTGEAGASAIRQDMERLLPAEVASEDGA